MPIKSTFLSSLHYHLCTMFQLTFFVIFVDDGDAFTAFYEKRNTKMFEYYSIIGI